MCKFPQPTHPFADIEDVKGERVLAVQDLRALHADLLALPLSRFEDGDLELLLALNELESYIAAGADSMVKADEFEDFARDYAEGVYDIPGFISTYVNWGGIANSMRSDYVEVEFLGQTYLCR